MVELRAPIKGTTPPPSIETLTQAAEQIEAVIPDSEGPKEVVPDKAYHSNQALVALEAVGVRSYISEPERALSKMISIPDSKQSTTHLARYVESDSRAREALLPRAAS